MATDTRGGRVLLHLRTLVWGQPRAFIAKERWHLAGIMREFIPEEIRAEIMSEKTRTWIPTIIAMAGLLLSVGTTLYLGGYKFGAVEHMLLDHQRTITELSATVVRIDRDGSIGTNNALVVDRRAAEELKQTVSSIRADLQKIPVIQEQIGWVLRAVERAERRSGYTPPPAPVSDER